MGRFRKPLTCIHSLGVVHFVGDGAGMAIKGPQNKRGFLVDVGIRVTETFACDSTAAKIRLGTASDADQYAELVISDGTLKGDVFNTCDDRDAIKGPELPEEGQIEVTFVNSADSGVAAGAGEVYAIIDWY